MKILIVLIMLLLSGCGKENIKSDKINVYTSIYPVYDFAQNIGGKNVKVTNLIPTGGDSHSWEPSIKDMADISECDVFFYNGAGMESYIDNIKNSIDSDVKFVELSEGLEISETENTENEEHNHRLDPHLWLDVDNGIYYCEKIRDTLIQINPENKNIYEENFNNYKKELDEVKAEYDNLLSNTKKNKIVVSHSAYGYICKKYNLEQIGINALSAEYEPSPKKIKEITDFIKENNIKYIFNESYSNSKLTEIIKEETGAEILTLNPIGSVAQEDLEKGYITLMRENLNNLSKALN